MVLELNGATSLYNHKDYSACCVYIYADRKVIENRLYNRYLAEDKDSVDGINAYNTRIAQNEQDFSVLTDFADSFFAFCKNEATVEECAEAVEEIFNSFTDGAVRDQEQIDKAIQTLQ